MLDCFTHTGSFALNAGLGGAREVLGVDASELAVEQAEKNAALNGLSDRVKFRCADVFALLPELEELALDVIERWLDEKDGKADTGRVLPREYLFFTGDGEHNHFRTEWDGGQVWDWSLQSPYEE